MAAVAGISNSLTFYDKKSKFFLLRLLQVVDVKDRLLRWRGEATFEALHSRHQDIVAEAFPTFLGVVDSHDSPAAF